MILKGKQLSDFTGMKRDISPEVYAFLEEWFDEKEYVTGHTSGSTGTPKEIRLSKSDMRASARITNEFFGIGAESVLLLCLSVSYIAGKMMVVRALEAGAELRITEVSSRPFRGWDGNPDGRTAGAGKLIELAAMVPLQVEETLKTAAEREVLSSVRQLIIGGAPVSPQLEQELQGCPVRCFATYGMTETVSHVALRELGKGPEYTAVGEVEFSLDGRGCLVIYAPHLQAREFITNDLVEVTDKRHFRWLGRYDYMINSGGLKFSPEVLEHKIAPLFSGRFFITSQPDQRLGERIVLVIEGPAYTKEKEQQLQAGLRQLLTPYEQPKQILYLPHFKETVSGKLIRRIG